VKPKNKTVEMVKAILIALFAALVLRQFVIASYNVPTGSMKDTILVGDFMFVNKFIYGARTPVWIGIPFTTTGTEIPFYRFPAISEPGRNDIVVFDYPDPKDPEDRSTDYIKRCVAVGGQTVEVQGESLFVDGKHEGQMTDLGQKYDRDERQNIEYTRVIDEQGNAYTIRHHTRPYIRRNYGPREVPPDHFFMMGDNRDNSLDSRSWGFVTRDRIGGKPLMIWLSWDKNVPGYRFYEKIRWYRLGDIVR
jgi:signal peptidase I